MQLYDYEKEHLMRLRKFLAECTVLLKSDGTFPLDHPGEIAAYGSGVRGTVKGGTGSGEVNSRYFITVEEGLKEAGFTVTTEDWLNSYERIYAKARGEFHKAIKKRAKANHTLAMVEGMGAVMPNPEYELPLDGKGDVAIYVVSRISGEGSDRKVKPGDILLSDSEKRDILALNEKYAKFMLVLNVGGPVDLTPVKEVSNILVLSQLGVETGSALADILLGKAYPSGKLATTWSSFNDYCSIGGFGEKDDTVYKEGVYVGYRYFDSIGKRALFPFGYGLGYTDFQISEAKIAVAGETVTVTAIVKNVGHFAGKETLQVYVSSPLGKLDKPYQALAGFRKSAELKEGEAEQLNISFKLSELASYDTEREAYILEKGNYVIRLGNNSMDTTVCGILYLEETVITRQVKNICGEIGCADWKPEKVSEEFIFTDEPVIQVSAAAFSKEEISYDTEYETEEAVGKLSDEQLAYVNIGAFSKGGILSMIGNASLQVAGAAGETTSALKDAGFPVIVMADGPAGLRLSKRYYEDAKGAHSIGSSMLESILEFMPKPAAWFMNRPPKIKKGIEVKEQYATAIPIGTAIAQSFNPDFAEMCGDIVGAEMERFGVHLWLAPALNIHRNILCGRNFEYYSEDPLVSGRFAAAVTRGVQKHPGCGVTIKHFACNNQETNRYSNNSIVSERALREIYLKGFEICVKESKPCALMTSYNLLNGVHTSEFYGLIQDILRAEWGYKGIVMTDWITGGGFLTKGAKYAPPHAGKVAAAGGDLFMPGSPKDYKEVLEALQTGILTRKQLEINASRVYRIEANV